MPVVPSNLETLLAEAVEIADEGERNAYVERVCAGDEQRRAELQSMVHDYFAAESLLAPPVLIARTVDQSPSAIGTVIGPYKLLEQIGEGGMGLVYMAEQVQPLRRLVALKIIKPGMDSRQVIARFEAERQALAMMEHPSIARILDAGTVPFQISDFKLQIEKESSEPNLKSEICNLKSPGRPYFVMELVRGIPITDFCEQKRLTVRQRLELFIQVCQAVQHAHQKGIIHRDLKPTNVLVTMHDSQPVPKVIDFGIAKALNNSAFSIQNSEFPRTGFAQLIGTPLYMSPEQADLNAHGVDTRSDVYSLGVLLYELLTGTTPFEKERLTKVGFDEMRRIIREEEPETVSTRIARTLATNPGASTGAKFRRRVYAALPELDWIAAKSLAKDRAERYESPSSLARDIERYLADEPVQACPPSAAYRFRKFAKKHRAAFTTTAIVAASLLIGTGVSLWQAIRATTAEAQAVANESKARAEQQKAVAEEQKALAAAAAERSAKEAETAQRKQAEKNFAIALEAVDRVMVRLVGRELREFPQLQPISQRVCKDALELYERLQHEFGDSPEIDFRIARAIYLSDENTQPRDVRKANFQRAVGLLEPLVKRFPDSAAYWRTLAECCYDAQKFFGDGRGDNPMLHEAMARLCHEADEHLARIDPVAAKRDGFSGRRALTTFVLYNLAQVRGDKDEAQRVLDGGIQLAQGLDDPVGGCLWRLLFAKSELPPLDSPAHEEYCWQALAQLRQWSERRTHTSAPTTEGDTESSSGMPQWVPFTHKRGRAWLADTLISVARRFESRHPEKAEALLHESSAVRRSVVKLYPWDIYLRGLFADSGLSREANFLRKRASELSTAEEKAVKLAHACEVLDEAVSNARQILYLAAAQAQNPADPDRDLSPPQHANRFVAAVLGYARCEQTWRSLRGTLPVEERRRMRSNSEMLLAEAIEIQRRLTNKFPENIDYKNGLAAIMKALIDGSLTPLKERAISLTTARSFAEAELAWREVHGLAERQLGVDHWETRHALQRLGWALHEQGQLHEAEVVLRQALTASETWAPDGWTTFYWKSLLGNVPLRIARETLATDPAQAQQKLAEAESLMLAGYEGMIARDSKHPAADRKNQRSDAIKRLIGLYEAWDKPAETAKWQAELEATEKAGN